MVLYIEAPRYEFAIMVKLKQGNCTGRCSWNKIKQTKLGSYATRMITPLAIIGFEKKNGLGWVKGAAFE